MIAATINVHANLKWLIMVVQFEIFIEIWQYTHEGYCLFQETKSSYCSLAIHSFSNSLFLAVRTTLQYACGTHSGELHAASSQIWPPFHTIACLQEAEVTLGKQLMAPAIIQQSSDLWIFHYSKHCNIHTKQGAWPVGRSTSYIAREWVW